MLRMQMIFHFALIDLIWESNEKISAFEVIDVIWGQKNDRVRPLPYEEGCAHIDSRSHPSQSNHPVSKPPISQASPTASRTCSLGGHLIFHFKVIDLIWESQEMIRFALLCTKQVVPRPIQGASQVNPTIQQESQPSVKPASMCQHMASTCLSMP